MQVRDIMNTHVRTATPETSVRDVAIIICFNKISGVPVVDGRREIQGVISEKDILSAMYPGVDDYMQKEQVIRLEDLEVGYRDIINLKVRDLMTPRVVTVGPDMPILKAVSVMNLHKIRRVPVAEDNRLAGIISIGDVHKAIFMRNLDCVQGVMTTRAREPGETLSL